MVKKAHKGKKMQTTYFVKASLFRFSKLCPISAPFSLLFINPSD